MTAKPHVLTKEDFFRPGENVHIQMSNEFPDYIGVVHTHKYIEVVYIISGNATHEIDGKKYSAGRGDLFIINKDTPHAFYYGEGKEPFVAYDLMFTPEFFGSSKNEYGALEDLTDSFMFYSLFNGQKSFVPYLSVSGSTYTIFGELFNKMYLEHRGRQKGYNDIIRAYLLELIITIFRMEDDAVKTVSGGYGKRAVSFVTEYIKKNYASALSVQEIADKVYMSRDYLGRIFRAETGMTVSAMIQKVRIERVCTLLSTTERTVADIAEECGFDDMKFFYTVFKKHMCVLPGDYRSKTRTEIK
ncbi:MAG: helix-turn-helix domain-containing protein [Clostridia bacterium]|nr:helix-turn-helix domain-containing protein [Clostridia bacterium]